MGVNPSASRWIFLGLAALIGAGMLAVTLLKPGVGPPPAEIARNPRLVAGREIFLLRCVTCHGEKGRGDGPMARGLTGPPPRNLVEDPWKHGDRPEDVLRVLNQGVPGTAMYGWSSQFDPDQLKCVAAYLYFLAGKPIPKGLE